MTAEQFQNVVALAPDVVAIGGAVTLPNVLVEIGGQGQLALLFNVAAGDELCGVDCSASAFEHEYRVGGPGQAEGAADLVDGIDADGFAGVMSAQDGDAVPSLHFRAKVQFRADSCSFVQKGAAQTRRASARILHLFFGCRLKYSPTNTDS